MGLRKNSVEGLAGDTTNACYLLASLLALFNHKLICEVLDPVPKHKSMLFGIQHKPLSDFIQQALLAYIILPARLPNIIQVARMQQTVLLMAGRHPSRNLLLRELQIKAVGSIRVLLRENVF